jgi:hypothetical protein
LIKTILAVISGTLVFISGQAILKIILEPVVSFKEAIGNICHIFLTNQADIRNGKADESLGEEIRLASSILLSKKQAIPKYKYISKILSLPNEQSLFRTCAYLNVISYKIVDDDKDLSTKKVKWSSKSKDCLEISMLIQKIEKELAVTLSYQSINVEELY